MKTKILSYFKHLNQCNRSTILFYFASCFTPVAIICLCRLFYLFDFASLHPNMLTLRAIPCCAVAGFLFTYYIRHSHILTLDNSLIQLSCSTIYSLCSYAISQESAITSLILYAIFPIIFLLFEKMVCQICYLPFVIGCALMMLINPSAGLPIFLLLFLLAMIQLSLQQHLTWGNFIHISVCFLFSFFLASARIFYYLAPAFANHSTYAYQGFALTFSPAMFFARFLPGVAASKFYVGMYNRADLYFSLFALFAVFCFFFQKTHSCKKRILYGVFTILLFGLIELSPIQYILNFFRQNYETTNACSFFLIFWMLQLIAESIPNIKKSTCSSLIFSCVIVISLEISAWLWCSTSFSTPAWCINIVFCIIYIIFLFISRYVKSFHLPKCILYILILLELTAHCVLSTNTTFHSAPVSANTQFFFEKNEKKSTELDADTQLYNDFIASTEVDAEIMQTLSAFSTYNTLSQEEIKKYCDTILPNDLEQINALCYKTGMNKPLFHPVDAEPQFQKRNKVSVTNQGNNLFNISSDLKTPNTLLPFYIEANTSFSDSIYCLETYNGQLWKISKDMIKHKKLCYLSTNNINPFSYNIHFSFYTMDNSVYKQIEKYVAGKSSPTKKVSSTILYIDYIGVALSYLSGMLLFVLLFYNSKKALYSKLFKMKEQFNSCTFLRKTTHFFHENCIYFLSFCIPVLIYIGCMIYTDCIPFGENSFFDSDGTALFLPLFMDNYHKHEIGNTFLSMNIGYGFDLSIYSTISALSELYRFLPMEYVAPMLLIMLGIALGCCGFTMTYYMTHRLTHKKAHKKDYFLLIPSTIYALNAYILTSHCFLTWYFTLILFPLLMLATDKLILRKKTLPYIILLAGCILLEIQLAMFMCIYLVIHFFTYQFDSIKDFFTKGIRFAAASLLAGGCGFLVVYRTLALYDNTLYATVDNQLPSLGLHTNFLEQWKKFMIFTETKAVSNNNGDLSPYCGILTLFLILIYFSSKEISRVEKLRKLIPILILFISFNGNVLSWLWNGMHYQSKVPNRYVFLLLFLLAEIAYDSFQLLKKASILKIGSICMSLIIFFFLCQHNSTGSTALAFLSTLILCMTYFILLFIQRMKGIQCNYHRLLIPLLICELGANAFFLSQNWGLDDLYNVYGNYLAQNEFQQQLKKEGDFFRCIYPAAESSYNAGAMYNTASIGGFNSYISTQQFNLQKQYGLLSNGNNILADYTSTPIALSLSGSRYIFVPMVANQSISNLAQYKYIGAFNTYYLLENKNALALGYYVPNEVIDFPQLEAQHPLLFEDKLARLFSCNGLSTFQTLSYNENTAANNSFYFTDREGKPLSFEEAEEYYINATEKNQLQIHLNYTPKTDGYTYLYIHEVIPITYSQKGKKVNHSCYYPRSSQTFPKEFNIVTLNDKVMQEFFTKIQKNQMEDITIANDTITGTTNYEEDGYTMFSIAYSKDWSAYIDGEPVEIENPFDSGIYVKTPAGKHTIELRFTPYGLRFGIIVTVAFWAFTFLLHGILYILNRRKMA